MIIYLNNLRKRSKNGETNFWQAEDNWLNLNLNFNLVRVMQAVLLFNLTCRKRIFRAQRRFELWKNNMHWKPTITTTTEFNQKKWEKNESFFKIFSNLNMWCNIAKSDQGRRGRIKIFSTTIFMWVIISKTYIGISVQNEDPH